MTGAAALDWLARNAADRERLGLRRRLSPRRPGETVLDLASNDYLGLASDPRVVAGAVAAARTWGAGSTGSRLVTGSTSLHAELEADLAAFVRTQAALVFSSGYLANIGVVSALAGRDGDCLVVSDALNHASLIDAARLSRARVTVTAHRDLGAIRDALAARTETRALVVCDALFSVDGDLAAIADLYEAAHAGGAALIIDEAHSLGVVGAGGVGATAAAGIADQPDVVQTLTLSKSLGTQGGAVAASADVVAHLIDTARTMIFDTGLAPPAAGAAAAALAILRGEPDLAATARERARQLHDVATAAGFSGRAPDGAVCSMRIGDPASAVAAAAVCASRDVKVGCFRPPSVPDGISRLRLTARSTLTQADLDRASDALRAARLAVPGDGGRR